MKKVHLGVIIAGAAVGLAALILTALGNPTNMGFCIACFLRDISGAVGLHSAAKVQYVRPEIIGLVLGAFIMSVASKEFKARAEHEANDLRADILHLQVLGRGPGLDARAVLDRACHRARCWRARAEEQALHGRRPA